MLDAVLAFLWASDMGGQTYVGHAVSAQAAASFIDLIYETKDGHMTVAVMSDKEWANLTRAVERPEWLEDPRFRTPALRDQNVNERLALIQRNAQRLQKLVNALLDFARIEAGRMQANCEPTEISIWPVRMTRRLWPPPGVLNAGHRGSSATPASPAAH